PSQARTFWKRELQTQAGRRSATRIPTIVTAAAISTRVIPRSPTGRRLMKRVYRDRLLERSFSADRRTQGLRPPTAPSGANRSATTRAGTASSPGGFPRERRPRETQDSREGSPRARRPPPPPIRDSPSRRRPGWILT